ncbi:MAG: redoxin family protein [Polyangiaceae bacterium]|nr:redoxin family protein [Polyangiaceae bacterium]MCB9609386.1 redoxin family protein [Polyangiaceae bacterium]
MLGYLGRWCGISLVALGLLTTQWGCGGDGESEGGEAGSAGVGNAGSGNGGSGAVGGTGAASQGGAGQGGSIGGAGGDVQGGSGGTGGDVQGGAGGTSALSCPPTGPYGSTVGDVVPDVTLYDCDGNAVSLHDLCDAPVSLVYTFAAWCPVCRSHMESGRPNQLLAAHQAEGFQEWVVVTQKTDGSDADAALCALTRDTYSLTPKVLFDPNDSLRKTVGVQVNSGGLVMTQGGRIELKTQYDFDSVETKVGALLTQ